MLKTALITGASQRIGKQIAIALHHTYNIIIHYRHSQLIAQNLANNLNNIRPNSATIIYADLKSEDDINHLTKNILHLNLLINNASSFYPTAISEINSKTYHQIMNVNVLAPLLLSQKFAKILTKNNGNIINIVDIHAIRPLKNYSIYNISKAAIAMLTKTLAKELAPNVRVNGISPGSILWSEKDSKLSPQKQQKILAQIALGKQGNPDNIAKAVLFLIDNDYITGQIINVDGGRTLNQ